jgi:eukaryotic-like serine/threonine-protein kinase
MQADSLIGQVLDNYRIDAIIGRGGMGVVFKATDLSLEKTVAIKMIDPFLAADEEFLKRFRNEAKTLARLENPNIVSVFTLRETSAGVFMVMEYMKGMTVSERMKETGRLPLSDVISIGGKLINAIAHSHSVDVIHRDIKPNNIMLCENGSVKVMDFGLAKATRDSSSQLTRTQIAAGTLYYMSPEQIKGLKNVDKRSDIYSIGMSLYEMAAGRTPFDKSMSEYDIQKQIIDGDIPSPVQFNPAIPKELVKIIKKCIDKDAAKRYQSTEELQKAFSQVSLPDEESEAPTVIRKDNTRHIITSGDSKKKMLLYALPAAAVILIALVIYLLLPGAPAADDKIITEEIVTPVKNEAADIIPVTLTINTVPPGADVILNGSKEGSTPFNMTDLSLSKYSLKLVKSGYEVITQDIDIKEGANNFDFKFVPVKETPAAESYLVLNAFPSSEILINNKPLGTSGIEIRSSVKPGKHNITFRHPRYGTKTTEVNLKEGQTRSLTCYFEQQVNIQSLNASGDAFWGTVYINNENTGLTTPVDLNLGPGKYDISVRKAGYRTEEDLLNIVINPEFEKKKIPLVFHFK